MPRSRGPFRLPLGRRPRSARTGRARCARAGLRRSLGGGLARPAQGERVALARAVPPTARRGLALARMGRARRCRARAGLRLPLGGGLALARMGRARCARAGLRLPLGVASLGPHGASALRSRGPPSTARRGLARPAWGERVALARAFVYRSADGLARPAWGERVGAALARAVPVPARPAASLWPAWGERVALARASVYRSAVASLWPAWGERVALARAVPPTARRWPRSARIGRARCARAGLRLPLGRSLSWELRTPREVALLAAGAYSGVEVKT